MTDQFRQPPHESMAESAGNLVRAWQEIARNAADIAHARRTLFQAYVAEGFNESQALELVKSI